MCTEPATANDVRAAMPHPVAGSAADPMALEPADEVVVTTGSILITGEVDRTTDFEHAMPQHTSTGPAQRGDPTR